jgi:hypothetical protein
LGEDEAAGIDRGRLPLPLLIVRMRVLVSAPTAMRIISFDVTPPRSANIVIIRSCVSPALPMAIFLPFKSAAVLMLGSATR